MTDRERCVELVREIAALQKEARENMPPKCEGKQCEAADALGMFCYLRAGHAGQHEHFDPILGIV